MDRVLADDRCTHCYEVPQFNNENGHYVCACKTVWVRGFGGVEGTEHEKTRFAESAFQEEKDGENVSYFNDAYGHRIWLFADGTWSCNKPVERGMSLSEYLDWFNQQRAIAERR